MPEDDGTQVIRFAYNEVLDATKHQDDKINRLLTAIAFLTGGALAVAALGGAEYLTRPYRLGGVEVHVTLVVVGVFFVGVVMTVLMLIGSLTTPLRLPSVPRAAERDDPGPQGRPSTGTSRIYFYDIARLSLGQWQAKWREASGGSIALEERDALVRETHNLAVRTEFKYMRTNEAVAVLSFALASLATAAVLVLVAAGHDPGPVPFDAPARASVATVLGVYVWLQVRTSLRHRIQSVEELHWVHAGPRLRGLCRLLFPIAAGAVPVLLMYMPFASPPDAQTYVVSACATIVSILTLMLFAAVREQERGRTGVAKLDGVLFGSALLAVIYGMVPWISLAFGRPEVSIIAAYAATGVILVAGVVASSGRTWERLDSFESSVGVGSSSRRGRARRNAAADLVLRFSAEVQAEDGVAPPVVFTEEKRAAIDAAITSSAISDFLRSLVQADAAGKMVDLQVEVVERTAAAYGTRAVVVDAVSAHLVSTRVSVSGRLIRASLNLHVRAGVGAGARRRPPSVDRPELALALLCGLETMSLSLAPTIVGFFGSGAAVLGAVECSIESPRSPGLFAAIGRGGADQAKSSLRPVSWQVGIGHVGSSEEAVESMRPSLEALYVDLGFLEERAVLARDLGAAVEARRRLPEAAHP